MDWWDVMLSAPRSRTTVTSPDTEAGERARRIRQARDRELQEGQRGEDEA